MAFPTSLPAAQTPTPLYSYEDVAGGIGYLVYYAATTYNGSKQYVLTNEAVYSDNIYEYGTTTSGTDVLVFNQNFDATFNLPRTAKGTVLISIPVAFSVSSGSHNIEATFTLIKVSGSTSTTLGTASTNLYQTTGTGISGNQRVLTTNMTIDRTHFKKGDTLRLQTQVYTTWNGVGGSIWFFGHDPVGRTGDGLYVPFDSVGTTSKLSLYMPYVINI
jgi:hypothetical protein